jgi:hypothetical protein
VIDIREIDAILDFDVDRKVATADATVRFEVDGPRPNAFDLRQVVGEAELDGEGIPAEALAHVDLGGGPGAEMRVIDRELLPGPHILQLRYELRVPDAQDAVPVGWDEGALFDLWMSDLYPGRYLEMWLPANLCHDHFSLAVDVQVSGGSYSIVHNGELDGRSIRYPEHYTALSPMLVILPTDLCVSRETGIVTVTALSTTEVDIDTVTADAARWVAGNMATYGEYVHGDVFTAYVWDSARGMEYDGATTASVGALEHEVFHSWFGRGVKPQSQNDGWIDEAYTTWSTASGRYEGERFAVAELGLDEDAEILSPQHPWCRSTPTASYRQGARLFAGIAHLAGGAEPLKRTMRAFYLSHKGRLVTTQQLERHLVSAIDEQIQSLFARYVYGRG